MGIHGYMIYEYRSFGFDEPREYFWSGTVEYPTNDDAKREAEETLKLMEEAETHNKFYVWPIYDETRNRCAMEAMSQAPI